MAMKKFADKVKEARETLGLSQAALAEKVEVSQRSITAYETGSAKPRGVTARRLAQALKVSVDYLLNEDVQEPQSNLDQQPYFDNIYAAYGAGGEAEARALLEKNAALFAGGTLSQDAKDAFFEAIMTAYVTCKEEARKTYGRKLSN
jgi:transcriptional regulator with XRE-family HTH domain